MGARWIEASREAAREALVVARDDLRASVRSLLAVSALALYALLNLAVAGPGLRLADSLRDRFADVSGTDAAMMAVATRMAWQGFYTFLTGSDVAAAAMLDVPWQAVFTFWAAALFAPAVCVLAAYDCVALDLQSGRMRFLVVRTRRASLVVGRWAARSALVAVVVALVTAAAFGLVATRDEGLPAGAWRHFVRYGALALATAPCWVAVATLASTLASTARGALMLALLLLLGLSIGGLTDSLGPLTPGAYKALLYSPATWPRGVAAYAAFAGAALLLAVLRLARRDI